MVSSAVRCLQALATISLAVTLVVGCGVRTLEQQVRDSGLAPEAIVRLADDWAVAARRDDANVRVLSLAPERNGNWTAALLASGTGSGTPTVHLISAGGDTGNEWNSYVYGTAPADVSRVRLTGFDGEGGQVVDGAWVLALPDKDVTPADLEWQLLDALGRVVYSGAGITSGE
jgi:hypothetical protein